MDEQQRTVTFPTEFLMARIAILENELADKNSVIAENKLALSKLTTDLEAARFEVEQMRRMIFGSKRERFVSNTDINQNVLPARPC
jgi:transposase